jgi:hypothetical protein
MMNTSVTFWLILRTTHNISWNEVNQRKAPITDISTDHAPTQNIERERAGERVSQKDSARESERARENESSRERERERKNNFFDNSFSGHLKLYAFSCICLLWKQ